MNLYKPYLFHFILLINALLLHSSSFAITPTNEADSLPPNNAPTIDTLAVNSDALEDLVEYQADDSMRFDVKNKKMYLFGNAQLKYQSIVLNAGYIEINLDTKELLATGTTDSLGEPIETPVFQDGGQEFRSQKLRYNFDTKKGKIEKAITQEGEGYIHGSQIKMQTDDVLYIKNGKYTTCSLDDPHFNIKATKLKYIKDDKIITGPAYLEIEHIPTPLALPFGFFPNKDDRTSGLIIPTYGESPGLGFFLNNGGYYWAGNDYMDLALTGDIYSRGSWGLNARSDYKVRYKFNGYVDLSYSQFLNGERNINQTKRSNYFIKWRFNQDVKARPNSRFSADVNFGSSKNFQDNYNSTTQDYLTNTFKSNVTYNKSWAGKPLNFAINGSHSQNSKDSTVNITLPEATFSISRIYPLKKLVKAGKKRWYETLGIAYTGSGKNTVNTTENIMTNYTDSMFSLAKNGIRHSIPVTTNIKAFKYLTISPNMNYTERWYFESVEKRWDYAQRQSSTGEFITDTVKSEITEYNDGFTRAGEFSFNSALTTNIYGMYNYKFKRLKAMRHVMTPSVSANFKPDYSQSKYGYYQTYLRQINDSTTQEIEYSIFDGQIYGGPSGKTQSGSLNFSIRNTLEAKVLGRKDTTNTAKKVKLFENLNFTSSYSIFADSLNWSPLRIYFKSRLNSKTDIQINTLYDPYSFVVEDNSAKAINTSYFNSTGKLLRLTNLDVVFSYRLKSKNTKTDNTKDDETPEFTGNTYVDFQLPWAFNVSYRFNYSRPFHEDKITNTVNFNGDFRLTPKWKVGFNSGYDIETKKFTYTSFDVYRDLHCWELSFNVVPFGNRRSYSVDLRVKASTLQDLKLSRKRNWYDFE